MLPGDELEVRFFHTPELNIITPVRPDGRISLPLAQGVVAAGKSPEQLAIELKERYVDELLDPRITVIVRSFGGRKVHVGGEVNQPGVLSLAGPMTVLDAITESGGMRDSACAEQVLVLRPRARGRVRSIRTTAPRQAEPYTPSQPYTVLIVDLAAVLNGSDTRQNIALRPFDAVYVPKSPIANVNKWIDQYIRRNIPFTVSVRPEIMK